MKAKTIEDRIAAIEDRNKKVEQDKKWESSLTRRISIGIITYVVVVGYLNAIKNDKPYVNALVPVMGYWLSGILLPKIRKIWQDFNK